MSVLNSQDLARIQSLAYSYYADTVGDAYGTDELGEIQNLAELRTLAHTLYSHSGVEYITSQALTYARWNEIKTAFGTTLLDILNQSGNNDQLAEVAKGSNTTVDKLNASNITACIQASEHGILDRTDSKVLFALWNTDINKDFVLSNAKVDRADAYLAGAATLFDWSEDSAATISGKIVLGGVLMAGMAFGSETIVTVGGLTFTAAQMASTVLTLTSAVLLTHGAYIGLQGIAAEQSAQNGIEEYLAMRTQGQAMAEIGSAGLGLYAGFRGMAKMPRSSFASQPRGSAANPYPSLAGVLVKNPPRVPTFSLFINRWISNSNALGPIRAFIDPKSGVLMILQATESLVAEYLPVSAQLATELLTAVRQGELIIPTTTRAATLQTVEAALCRSLDLPPPVPSTTSGPVLSGLKLQTSN